MRPRNQIQFGFLPIFLLVIVFGGIISNFRPVFVWADANLPTETPIPPTPDLAPTFTPEPTEVPQDPELDFQIATAEPDNSIPLPDENANAPTESLIGSLSTPNLCLLGLVVLLLVGVMIMVVYGVIQRVSK